MKRLYDQLMPSLGHGSEAAPAFAMAKGSQGYIAHRNMVRTHQGLVSDKIDISMARRNQRSEAASLGSVPAATFYMEHRSLVTHHTANTTRAWAMASIAHLLAQDPPKIAEVRARALLKLACAEQVAMDSGSWVYAADLMMHDQNVPMASLEGHNPHGTQTAHSELIDPQWFEVGEDQGVGRRTGTQEESSQRPPQVAALAEATAPEQALKPQVPGWSSGKTAGHVRLLKVGAPATMADGIWQCLEIFPSASSRQSLMSRSESSSSTLRALLLLLVTMFSSSALVQCQTVLSNQFFHHLYCRTLPRLSACGRQPTLFRSHFLLGRTINHVFVRLPL